MTAVAHSAGPPQRFPESDLSSAPGRVGSYRNDSVGQIIKELASDTSTLVRQEITLAQAELQQKAKAAGKGAGMLAGAAVLGLALLGALTVFLIAVIALAVPIWAAALCVVGLYAAVAGGLALNGRHAVKQALPPRPEQTIETMKEDLEWAKTLPPSGRK